jgi:hypothetical protein
MRIRYDHKLWDIHVTDGVDTVIVTVQPISPKKLAENAVFGQPAEFLPVQEVRFESEYVNQYRNKDGEMTDRGLRILGREAAQSYEYDTEG